MTEMIREITLRELIASESISRVEASGQRGGFSVMVECGNTQRVLASTRGGLRMFPNLTNLTLFLRRLGVSRFEVNSADYVPGRSRAARPDRAEALRRTRTKPHQPDLLSS